MTDRRAQRDTAGPNLGRTIALSVLLHVLLAVALWRLAGNSLPHLPTAAKEPIWVNWAPPAAPSGRLVEPARTPNSRPPDAARHLAQRSNAVPRETRRSDSPINPRGGPPSRGNPSSDTRSDRIATSPAEPPDPFGRLPRISAKDLLNQSRWGDFSTSRVATGTYNPDVPDTGDAVWLNTHEYKYVGYFMHLKEKIESAWRMTRPPYDREHAGVLQMTIRADGALANVSLIETCGVRDLDLAILRAVRVSAPFNPLPKEWNEDELKINVGFQYMISERASIFGW